MSHTPVRSPQAVGDPTRAGRPGTSPAGTGEDSGAPRTAFVFAGQGSQYLGMGEYLHDTDPVFRRTVTELGRMFGDHGIPGLPQRLFAAGSPPADALSDIRLSHPGIVMVELALFDALVHRDVRPDLLVGASLGEFAALTAAGGIDREQLVAALAGHVALLERHCPVGGMLAVLADPRYFTERWIDWGALELAAVNTDEHFVVAGPVADVDRAVAELQDRRVMSQVLPIDYAFHSSLIDAIHDSFEANLARLDLRPAGIRLVSCATTTIAGPSLEHLWAAVREPIRWQETVSALESEPGHRTRWVDLSPSGSMHGFLRAEFGARVAGRSCALTGPFLPDRPVLDAVAEIGVRPAPPPAKGDRMLEQVRTGRDMSGVTTALLFPGQGSQYRGMGRDLFPRWPELAQEADDALGFSIERLCVEDPDRLLSQTEYTQPALFVVNALHHRDLLERGEVDPDRVLLAGHSLGEFNALHAAGVLSFGDGVRAVRERGLLMSRLTGGGMAAVIGLSEAEASDVLSDGGFTDVDLANINSPVQIVLSGPRERLMETSTAFKDAGARFIPLQVSGAFHSRYLEPSRLAFEDFLGGLPFGEPRLPVLSSVTGDLLPSDVRALLGRQLVSPVRWVDLVRGLRARGIEDLREVGPGQVLTKLNKAIIEHAEKAPAETTHAAKSRAEKPAAAAGERNGSAAHDGSGAPASGATLPRPIVPEASVVALGSAEFRRDHGVDLAYVCGGMYRGIASTDLVCQAARGGLLTYFGAGGLSIADVATAVDRIVAELGTGAPFGVNVVHDPLSPAGEEELVDLCLRRGVRRVEASAFIKVSAALVRYRLAGLRAGADGGVETGNKILAKVSRPEVAAEFLAPPSPEIVADLVRRGLVTAEQARLGERVPMADDLCAEGDSGGHTDRRNPLVLYPAIATQRDRARRQHGYPARVRVGIAGGIGTPHAAAAAFAMGADFVTTGSINLCTAESGMSDEVKDLLQEIDIHDTDYAPAGDMFEFGAQVQVVRKGVFFPARARKLHELYRTYNSLDDLPTDVRELLEKRYFQRGLDAVWAETDGYFRQRDPEQLTRAASDPRHRMALAFRWYFGHSQRAAMTGDTALKLDFQIHCGPCLGAFNQWVRDTELRSWRERHVEDLAQRIMRGAGELLAAAPGRGGGES